MLNTNQIIARIGLVLAFCAAVPLQAQDQSVLRQRALTTSKTLSNGVIFVQREIPHSEISYLEVNVRAAQADLPEDNRAINALTFDLMPLASKKYTKEKIFNLTEQYAIRLQCNGGIEQSGCQFETVTDHFDKAFDIFVSTLKEPLFNTEDLEVIRERRIANYQHEEQNPEKHVNTLVNTIYYPAGHPYRQLPKDAITQIAKLKREDLIAYHKSALNGFEMQIVYVGPKLSPAQQKRVEAAFASIPSTKRSPRNVPAPAYNSKNTFMFEHRPIPTAYIRAKFNAPGATSADAAASRVLFEILGEELHEEVRTKRSLSYSIYGMTLQLEQGLGVLVASTSKPREAIEAMAIVLKKIRDVPYSDTKLAEYKNVFTTSHYLTLETHSSFAGALSAAQLHFGDANKLYEFPAKIAAVTSADVQRLAKALLTQMRVAVIYDKEKFMPEWVEPLTKM